MKPFLVFSGPTYYPGGGWDDFDGAFATIQEASAATLGGEWAHIVDLRLLRVLKPEEITAMLQEKPGKGKE